jgi:hypothetical protein
MHSLPMPLAAQLLPQPLLTSLGPPHVLLLQVKIAELPLDSFRMLQTLEWEDAFSSPTPPATEHPLPLSTSKSRSGSEVNGSKGAGSKGTDSGSDGGERLLDGPRRGLGVRPNRQWSSSTVVVCPGHFPASMLLHCSMCCCMHTPECTPNVLAVLAPCLAWTCDNWKVVLGTARVY